MSFENLTKIATGPDSQVYLHCDGETIYKSYAPILTDEILNWYAGLTQKLSLVGQTFLKDVKDEKGIGYRVTCSVNAHKIFSAEDGSSMTKTKYIPGPTLISFYKDDRAFPGQSVAEYIATVPDLVERQRLLELNIQFQEDQYMRFLERVYDVYSQELSAWIATHLPVTAASFYSYPGEMNIKLRMPEDNTIHFVVTDIYGDIFKGYHLCHQEI